MTDPSTPPVLTVIGAGRLGRVLARLWADRGVFAIGDLVTRDAATAAGAARFVGAGRPRVPGEALAPADVALVSVPDDRLGEAAAWLAGQGALRPGALAFHCSGAHAADLLAPLRDAGAAVASAHPVHSFADPARSLAAFAGSACALEGDDAALDRLEPAFAAIGGRPLRIRGDAKLLYHAGAVFASNYVTVLTDTALRLLHAAGLDDRQGRELLGPLLRGAVDSALALGPGAALTGPVVRGDAALVARQAEAVADHDIETGALYRALADAAAHLAAGAGRLDPERAGALRAALAASAEQHPHADDEEQHGEPVP